MEDSHPKETFQGVSNKSQEVDVEAEMLEKKFQNGIRTRSSAKAKLKKPKNFENDKVINVNGVFNCSSCNFSAKVKCEVTKHYNRHHLKYWDMGHDKNRTWKCTECVASYTTVKCLKYHLLTVHNIKIITCKMCNFKTTDQKNFKKHKCSRKKRFQCSKCLFTAELRIKVAAHEKTHLRVKENSVKRQTNKNEISKNGEEEKEVHASEATCQSPNVLVCDLCFQYKAESSKHLQRHRRQVHKVYSNFRNETNLIFTELNFYICDACSFETAFFEAFETHLIESHKYEKVNKEEINKKGLKCSACSRRFWCGYTLALHKYTSHRDETDLNKWSLKCIMCDKFQTSKLKNIKSHFSRAPCCKSLAKNDRKFQKYFNGTFVGLCKWNEGESVCDIDASDDDTVKDKSTTLESEAISSKIQERLESTSTGLGCLSTNEEVVSSNLKNKLNCKKRKRSDRSSAADLEKSDSGEDSLKAKRSSKNLNKSCVLVDNLDSSIPKKKTGLGNLKYNFRSNSSRNLDESSPFVDDLNQPFSEKKTGRINSKNKRNSLNKPGTLQKSNASPDKSDLPSSEEETEVDHLINKKIKKERFSEPSAKVDDLEQVLSEGNKTVEVKTEDLKYSSLSNDLGLHMLKDETEVNSENINSYKETTALDKLVGIWEDLYDPSSGEENNQTVETENNEIITIEVIPDDNDETIEFSEGKNQEKPDSNQFVCSKPTCGFYCFNFAKFQQHVKLHRKTSELVKNSIYECQKCGSSDLHSQMLQIHTNFHAKTDGNPSTKINYLKYVTNKVVDELTIKATASDDDKNVQKEFQASDGNTKFDVVHKQFLKDELDAFDKGSDGSDQNQSRIFKCQTCQHIISNRGGLKYHTNVHGRTAEDLNIEISYLEYIYGKCTRLIKMSPDLNCFTNKYKFKCEECDLLLTRPFLEGHANEHSELELDPNFRMAYSVFLAKKFIGYIELELQSETDALIHTYQPTYRCSECRMPLTSKHSLLRHVNNHAKRNRKIKEVVFSEFKNKVLLSKIKIKANENSNEGDDLNIDSSSDHSEFCCTDCDYTTTDKDAFKKHTSFHWIPEVKRKPRKIAGDIKIRKKKVQVLDVNISPDHPLLKCNECNFKSTSEDTLQQHKDLHWNAEKQAEYNAKIQNGTKTKKK